MDYKQSIHNLNLSEPFSLKQLKHAYHKSCLKYHPDRTMCDTREEFNRIRESYEYLLETNSFTNEIYNESTEKINDGYIYSNLIKRVTGFILKTQCELYREAFYRMMSDIGVPESVISEIKGIVSNKNDTYEIYPTIDNLLNDDVYRLIIDDAVYIIPMWWGSTTIDTNKGTALDINMKFNLPNHIKIDCDNNMIVYIARTIKSLSDKDVITLDIGKRIHNITIKILDYQVITLPRAGLMSKDIDDIVDDVYRKDIIIHLTLV
jgi:hypothetical protein